MYNIERLASMNAVNQALRLAKVPDVEKKAIIQAGYFLGLKAEKVNSQTLIALEWLESTDDNRKNTAALKNNWCDQVTKMKGTVLNQEDVVVLKKAVGINELPSDSKISDLDEALALKLQIEGGQVSDSVEPPLKTLKQTLRQHGYELTETEPDGNCFFRAFSGLLEPELEYKVLRHLFSLQVNAYMFDPVTGPHRMSPLLEDYQRDLGERFDRIQKDGEWMDIRDSVIMAQYLQKKVVVIGDNGQLLFHTDRDAQLINELIDVDPDQLFNKIKNMTNTPIIIHFGNNHFRGVKPIE